MTKDQILAFEKEAMSKNPEWQYLPLLPMQSERTVMRIWPDGTQESCVESRKDVRDYVKFGFKIKEPK